MNHVTYPNFTSIVDVFSKDGSLNIQTFNSGPVYSAYFYDNAGNSTDSFYIAFSNNPAANNALKRFYQDSRIFVYQELQSGSSTSSMIGEYSLIEEQSELT